MQTEKSDRAASGYKGVKMAKNGKYVPRFCDITFGTYDDPETAHEIYLKEREKRRVRK